jgi:hypothetical protein
MSARSALPRLDSWLAPRGARGATALARPVVSAAAIRIPERVSAQLAMAFPSAAPQLFIHEGARQSLQRKLEAAWGPGRPVILSITDNRHSIISHSTRSGVLQARIHHMFLDAPARVINALVRYVAKGDPHASQLVSRYIDANSGRLARRRARAIPLVTKGDCHDVLANLQSPAAGGNQRVLTARWMRSASVLSTLARAKLLSFASTRTHGARRVLVRATISFTARW